jgi:hypothetical protein
MVYLCAAQSPHIVDVELLRLGLHDEPAYLRDQLQTRIDASTGQGYDAIVLAYGLCGLATAGLMARDIPLVMPRAHDCITLFLGDRARYKDQFENNPGTYWYALDYIERKDGSGTALGLGSNTGTNIHAEYDAYVGRLRGKVWQGKGRLPDGGHGRLAKPLSTGGIHRPGHWR